MLLPSVRAAMLTAAAASMLLSPAVASVRAVTAVALVRAVTAASVGPCSDCCVDAVTCCCVDAADSQSGWYFGRARTFWKGSGEWLLFRSVGSLALLLDALNLQPAGRPQIDKDCCCCSSVCCWSVFVVGWSDDPCTWFGLGCCWSR